MRVTKRAVPAIFAFLIALLIPGQGLLAARRPVLGVVIKKPTPAGFAARGSLLRKRPSRLAKVIVAIPGGDRVLITSPNAIKGWYQVAVLDYPDAIAKGYIPKKDVKLVDLEKPFLDIRQKHWAFPAIKELADAGLVQGSEEQFLGKKPFSRYEMAVVLARLVRQLKRAKKELDRRVNKVSSQRKQDSPPAFIGTYISTGVKKISSSEPKKTLVPKVKKRTIRHPKKRVNKFSKKLLTGLISVSSIDRTRIKRLEARVTVNDQRLQRVSKWLKGSPRGRRRSMLISKKRRSTAKDIKKLEEAMTALRKYVDHKLASAKSRMAKMDIVIPALAIERTMLASTKRDLDLLARTVSSLRNRLTRVEGHLN